MTGIQWTEETWNPTTGCDRVSPGCDHCYALTMAARLKGMGSAKYQRDGDPQTSGPGFGLSVHQDTLDTPLRWKKPRKVFVNSMSDLFHDQVSSAFIASVFDVMRRTPQHTYQILTKRHARLRSLMRTAVPGEGWPLPNVHGGVTVEDQHWANLRIPALVETLFSVRFLSVEPLLGPVNLDPWLWLTGASTAGPFYDSAGRRRFGGGIGGQTITCLPARDLHWVIVGGESGPGARPMELDWARVVVAQCQEAGVPVFVKQLGSVWAREAGLGGKGGDPDYWPADLRVREFPEGVAS